MKWLRVYLIVSAGALAGLLMGGVFGFGAGLLAPSLFGHLVPWPDVEPLGVAIVYGAIAGVLLGGGLAAFGLILQAVTAGKRKE